jgi:hypothetical protein
VSFSFPGAHDTEANGLNDNSVIVGTFSKFGARQQGFQVRHGAFSSIDFPGSSSTIATKVNNAGDIVGTYVGESGQHGYVLTKGKFITIDGPGAQATFIAGVNNLKQIVGGVATATSFNSLAFKGDCADVF